jgi:hypothetical protein
MVTDIQDNLDRLHKQNDRERQAILDWLSSSSQQNNVIRDDREEPGNCFFSHTFGKATKTIRKTKGVPYSGRAALVQARR